MKKTLVMLLAGLALVSSGFAKSVKVASDKLTSLNSVAKISDSLGLEAVENYDDLFVSKSDDGKTFTIFYKENYDDGDSIQLALVCANGTVSSRALYIEKGLSSPERYTLLETDRAVKFDDAGNGEYLTDFGSANSTMGIMELRYNIRTELAGKYGLVFPDSVKKSDSNFKKALDANIDAINEKINNNDKGAGTVDLIKKVTNSFFAK